MHFVLVSAARAAFCLVLFGFGLVSAVLCGFMYFVLVSAALTAFCVAAYDFWLIPGNFTVLCGFIYFVLVSAALAAYCWVLYGLGLFSAGFAVLHCFTCFVLVSAARREIIMGSQVEVTGLVNKAELNGHSTVALRYVQSRARWAVPLLISVKCVA